MDESTAVSLTPAQRKALRAQAHHLKPVVMIGDAGLTDAVLAEADRALRVHELIKIRVLGDDRATRGALMAQVCAGLDCAPVQSIGKLLVVYRPRPEGDETAEGQAASKRRRRGPHRPKKAAGASAEARTRAGKAPGAAGRRAPSGGKAAAGRGAAPAAGRKAKAGAARAAPTGKAPRSTGARKKATSTKKALSTKTAGKRTDLASASKPPARRGTATKATQGPEHLQGKPGPRTAGRRNRAKGGG